MSWWANVQWANVLMGKCSMGKCPMGKCPMGKCPIGKCLWYNLLYFRSEHEIRRRINLLVKDYIDFTNDILAKYSFSRDGSILQLYIKRIRQLSHTEGCSVLDSKYCEYSENLHDLLVRHSQSNHNDYCLSFVFTYQHLSDSTLGLSWIANSNKGEMSILAIKYWF